MSSRDCVSLRPVGQSSAEGIDASSARHPRWRATHGQKGFALMDPRIERWAKTLVNYCLQVQVGQMVLLIASPVAEPLLAEVYRETLRAGGHPVTQIYQPA